MQVGMVGWMELMMLMLFNVGIRRAAWRAANGTGSDVIASGPR